MNKGVELKEGDNLGNLLPLLSEGLCGECKSLLEKRLHSLNLNSNNGNCEITLLSSDNDGDVQKSCSEFYSAEEKSPYCFSAYSSMTSNQNESLSSVYSDQTPVSHKGLLFFNGSPASLTSRAHSANPNGSSEVNGEEIKKLSMSGVKDEVCEEVEKVSVSGFNDEVNGEFKEVSVSGVNNGLKSDSLMGEGNLSLSGEENEQIRFSQVGRKRDFVHYESVDGKKTNVLQGLELHTRVFNAEEQNKIVNYVYSLQRMGQAGKLRERTYSEPSKWMRGKGRVTIQFGCCYNYAMDKNGNPPGILRDEQVDPLPSLFKSMIKRLVRWHILPPTCIPNSCIVNIYDEGDCIPPHIDHHDFLRPFCTASFLTECNILFGSKLKILGPGEFYGPVNVPLPVGSVLILNGNGANVAKHCVPGVPAKRISITFRKMDDSKLPYKFLPDPELKGIQPLVKSPSIIKPSEKPVVKQAAPSVKPVVNEAAAAEEPTDSLFKLEDDFPPLGSGNKPKSRRR